MAKKYLSEDNIKNILSGIEAKIPKELEVNINTNVNRVKVELLDSPVTLTINSWGSISLNQSVLNFDEIEIEFAVNLGSNIQFRKYTISKSIISSMTTSDRYLEPLVIDAAVSSNKISQYARVIMRVDTSDYSKLEFNAGFGATSFTAEVIAIRGINYTQSYGDTPLGTIISYMGITPPDEYLSCDGTTYNIQDYWELAEFIKTQFGSYNYFGGDGTTTFAVPDLRGEFLRGTGTNSHTNQGSGSSVGTHQNATTVPTMYTTGTSPDGFGMWTTGTGTQMLVNNADGGSTTAHYAYISLDGKGAQVESTGLKNVRPTNTSVLYCIKYTNSLTMQPANVYSTTEKRIGTWIDGSPLYQRTYSATSPSAVNTSADIVTLDSNMSVKEISGILDSPTVLMLNHYVSTTDFATIWKTSVTGNIRMSVGSTSYTSKPVYVTIKYTKI